jgi:hypothetical protein
LQAVPRTRQKINQATAAVDDTHAVTPCVDDFYRCDGGFFWNFVAGETI